MGVVQCKPCGARGYDENEPNVYEYNRFLKVKDFYVCRSCQEAGNADNQDNQKEVIGRRKKHGWRYGFELETVFDKETLFLYGHNFKLKYDSSVAGSQFEWVSPIYEGLHSISRVLKAMEKEFNIMRGVSRSCGTHIHISNHDRAWNNFVAFIHIGNGYEIFFKSIADHMQIKIDQTSKIWGRRFNRFCQPYFSRGSRYVWVNPSLYHGTLEYRLSKLRNPQQFMKLFGVITDITQQAFEIYKQSSHTEMYEQKAEINTIMLNTYLKSIGNR